MNLDSFQCIEMAIFNTSGLTGTYQGLNLAANYVVYSGNGFASDIKVLKMYNASNVGITLSYDGVTNHDYIPASGTFVLDLQANHADNANSASGTLNGRQGQIVFGLGSAGTGNLYIIGYR